MDNTHKLTTYYDGNLIDTLESDDMIKVVDTWHKCVDAGNAKEYATYTLSDSLGNTVTKTFQKNRKKV